MKDQQLRTGTRVLVPGLVVSTSPDGTYQNVQILEMGGRTVTAMVATSTLEEVVQT